MNLQRNPIVMEFPLRGEWSAPNTPGSRIPSHGTNRLGARYAYDFLQVDWKKKGKPCYPVSFLRYLIFGVPVNRCFCYGKAIYAPCDGTVYAVEDGCPERKTAWLLSDLRRAGKNSRLNVDSRNAKTLTGNSVILQYQDDVYAAFCHLQPGSIQVRVGQTVKKGTHLGNIGHTGNSFFPHLHFQLMDSPDPAVANGLPCVFRSYERFQNGTWEPVWHGIPTAVERIRFTE